MRVALTREAGRNDTLRARVPVEFDVVEVPLTRSVEVGDDDFARQLLTLGEREFSDLVVTSSRAAPRAAQVRARARRVLSVGATTTAALAAHGVSVAAEASGARELARRVGDGPILFVGALESRPELADELAARGLELTRLVAYETVTRDLGPDERARLAESEVVLIGAPSAWRAAAAHVRDDAWVIVPGETTAGAVRAEHARVLVGWGSELTETLSRLARTGR